MGRNQNTFAKRQRETEKKRKAAEKIARRRQRSSEAKGPVDPITGEPLEAEALDHVASPDADADADTGAPSPDA